MKSKNNTPITQISILSYSVLVILILFLQLNTYAQTSDEKIIRDLVEQQNQGKNVIKSTENRIFVSGAFPRAFIGPMDAATQKIADSLRTVRLNQTNKQNIIRLEVAKSGDMAYEYGEGTIAYNTPQNQHISFNNSYVRVWKKVNGEWMVDLFFARPNPK